MKKSEEKSSALQIEDFIIIWLDAVINNDHHVLFKRQFSLDISSNCIHTFVDQYECVEYIRRNENEHIFLVVSGSLGENIVPLVHNLSQICKIYIFCADKAKHTSWSKAFIKVQGIFIDESPLMTYLKSDIKIYSNATVPISIGYTNERSLQDINEEQVDFLWFQLLIGVIYRLPQTLGAKSEMIEECRENYADNPFQLRMIDEFYEKYTADSAIHWYTKDCFLYRLLNRAFRTQNIDIIFNYHYFLTDLFKQLTTLHQDQFGDKTGRLNVYRGQYLNVQELEKLKNNIGRLVSINTFLSTSAECCVAVEFSGNGEHQSKGIESVIFEIDIDLAVQRRPFARINKCSANKDEKEILIAMGSVFRIEEVELYTDYIWLIKLVLSNEVKEEVENLFAYFTQHIGKQPSILEFGVLLSKIGDFERAKRFYQRLLVELPSDDIDLGVLYNNLGEIYRQQGYSNEAMEYYKKAIQEFTETVGFRDEWFAVVHSNMAMIFEARGEFERAITYYRCALFIIQHIDSDDAELFSTVYHGMATSFQKQGKLMAALHFYQKVLNVENQVLPAAHPSIATTYTNIGQLLFTMKNMAPAFDCMHKALTILLDVLPKNHPQLAVTYGCIGGMHFSLGQDFEAINYCLKAEATIDQSTLAPDHKIREDIYLSLCALANRNKWNDISIRIYHKIVELFNARTPPDLYWVAFYANNLGKMYFDKGNHDLAVKYHNLALDSIQQLSRTEINKRLYASIVDAFQYIGYFDISREHFTLLLQEEIDSKSSFAANLHNKLGVLYDSKRQDLLAIKHYTAALQCYMNWPDTHRKEIAITRHNIAVIQRDLGDYEQACLHLRESLSILSEDEYDLRSQFCSALAETCTKIKNWTCAREYFQKAIILATQAKSTNSVIATYKTKLENVISMMDNITIENSIQE
ncbi:unnamed protein product [Rotaria socialis]